MDLYAITTTELSSTPDFGNPLPGFVLEANYPNPFNPRTTIGYRLDQPATVELTIFDSAGRLVQVLEGGVEKSAGRHDKVWNGRDLYGRCVASGAYFYRLRVGDSSETGKMSLVR